MTLIKIIALSLFIANMSYAAGVEGHGGRVLKCLDENGNYSYELVDFDISQSRWKNIEINLQNGTTTEEKFAAQNESMSQVDPVRALKYRRGIQDFFDPIKARKLKKFELDERGISPIFYLGKKIGCEMYVVVNQNPKIQTYSWDAEDNTYYWIADDLKTELEQHSPKTMAGIYLHELVIQNRLESPGASQTNPEQLMSNVQLFTAYLSSTNLTQQKFGSYEYEQTRAEAGMPTSSYITSEFIQMPVSYSSARSDQNLQWVATQISASKNNNQYHYQYDIKYHPEKTAQSISGVDGILHYKNLQIPTTGAVSFYPSGKVESVHTNGVIEVPTHNNKLIKVSGKMFFNQEGTLLFANLESNEVFVADLNTSSLHKDSVILISKDPSYWNIFAIVIIPDPHSNGFGIRQCKLPEINECSVIGGKDFYSKKELSQNIGDFLNIDDSKISHRIETLMRAKVAIATTFLTMATSFGGVLYYNNYDENSLLTKTTLSVMMKIIKADKDSPRIISIFR